MEKEYSEFKRAKLRLKIDLVSYPARASREIALEGLLLENNNKKICVKRQTNKF